MGREKSVQIMMYICVCVYMSVYVCVCVYVPVFIFSVEFGEEFSDEGEEEHVVQLQALGERGAWFGLCMCVCVCVCM